MKENEAFWTIIGVVVGAVLAWFLSELSQFLRNKGEVKRIVNNVIFNLLNIRFELTKLDNDNVSAVIVKQMHEKMGVPLPRHDVNEIEEIVKKESKELLAFNVFESLEEISKQFDDVLQEFAKFDPISAYRLSDEAKIFRKLDDLEDYIDAVQKKYGAVVSENIFTELETYLKDKVFKESIDSLEIEIINLSRRTSRKKRKLILEKLNNQNTLDVESDDLNELLNIVQSGIK